MVRPPCFGGRVETNLIDGHTKCIDVARDGGLMSSIFRSQQFRCGPVDRRFGKREGIRYDCVQAGIREKRSWRPRVAD